VTIHDVIRQALSAQVVERNDAVISRYSLETLVTTKHDFLHDRCAVVPHPSLEESHVLPWIGRGVSEPKKRNLAFHSSLLVGEG